ncbi:MAG: hypothetical protein NTY35_02730 [Planctomycetota bacterium]|nr:hypothetical protein [Planctomycetota bacterium]
MRDLCKQIVLKATSEVVPQFRLDARGGIHGVPHWTRVWYHGRQIAHELEVNPAVLAWFAFLHDSQRRNDGTDPLHGARAADYATRLRRRGVITELDGTHFEQLCEAMLLHSEGATIGEPVVQACWDADRLDLGRVSIRPRADRLCTAPARRAATIECALRMSIGQRRSP